MEQPKCYVINLREIRKEAAKKLLSKGTIVKVAGITFILLAASPDISFASTGIDVEANKLYKKLLTVAKWVIVFKGGMDTIKNVSDGDFTAARKGFLGYLVTYMILWALPWGMSEVDKMFSDMEAAAP